MTNSEERPPSDPAVTPAATPALTIARTFAASAADLFQAWTETERLRRWLAADADVAYVEVAPGERLVMTWRELDADGDDEPASVVTVELREVRPGSTKMTLTHAQVQDVGLRAQLASDWPVRLDRLARAVGEPAAGPSGAPGSRKTAALSFLRLASSGKVREAYAAHVGPGFRHHNPFFADDAASLLAGMEENARTHPRKVLEIQRAIEEGDLVAVHSRVRLQPGQPGVATMHIFRFAGDRIVELWDVGQPVPEDSPNASGMF